ncbi:MAG: sulfatase [Acidobacteriota bacterium]|nr:sulfatase [Acidobacteriota bacterium]
MTRTRLGYSLLLCASSVWFLSGFSPKPPRPNVLLITLDTVRPDHLGFYGYRERPTTPNLDRWASSARVYDSATTSMPYTAPTHLSFLTGLRVLEHGLLTNGSASAPKLHKAAEFFRERGYDTGGFVSSYVLNRRFGFDSGFQTFDDGLAPSRKGDNGWWAERYGLLHIDRNGEETVDKAVQWLSGRASEPWFLWVHLFDAHEPYAPPVDFAGRFSATKTGADLQAARYDEEILWLDHLVGRLFQAADRDGRPRYTVVLSDHGQGLSEHGENFHGDKLYDQTIRLVFAATGPDIKPGRDPEPLGAAGVGRGLIALSRGANGREFQATLGSRAADDDPRDDARILIGRRRLLSGQIWDATMGPVSSATTGDLGLVQGRWRLIVKSLSTRSGQIRLVPGTSQLFDTAEDPHEIRDLAASRPAQREQLERELAAIIQRNQSRFLLVQSPPDAEVVKSLRALGYLE